MVVEIFLDPADSVKPAGKLGLRALPIDKDPKRAESCAVANYDLSDPQQYSTLVEVLHAERESIIHAHCAPSCGTASRARGRKVPGMPLHLQPQPLRSDDYPDGLPKPVREDRPELTVQMLRTRLLQTSCHFYLGGIFQFLSRILQIHFFGRPAGYKSFCSVFMMAMTLF